MRVVSPVRSFPPSGRIFESPRRIRNSPNKKTPRKFGSPKSPVDPKVAYNPFDSSIDDTRIIMKKCRSPNVKYSRKEVCAEPARHSYPSNAFVRKTRDLRCFILQETERLISNDGRSILGAQSRQELAAGVAPNCAIRKRMFKLGLL